MDLRMLEADLFFNAWMAAFDLLLARVVLGAHRRRERIEHPGRWCFFALTYPLFLAFFTAVVWGHRVFATLRFVGMALFGHLPLLLAVSTFTVLSSRLARRMAAAAVLGLALVYAWAYHVEPYWLEITTYRFRHPQLEGLRRPVKIIQLADIQTDHVGPWEEGVFARAARLEPDLVLMAGDYLHTWSPAEYRREAEKLRKVIARSGLNPPLGMYAVEGDSDLDGEWKHLFRGLPVTLLEDETVVVTLPGARLNLIGLSLARCRTRDAQELAGARRGRDPGALDVYLGHSPDFVDALPRGESFLAIAGHTHGGQVQLPLIGPPMTLSRLPRRFADDFLPFGSGFLSVSRGVGMERADAPRLRFMCRPEIRQIRLEGGKDHQGYGRILRE